MPRGVASIDPQNFPPLPHRPRLGLARRAAAPPRSSRSSPPSLPRAPLVPGTVVYPLRRPDHPSWFTSLFTVSLSHLPAPPRTPAPTPPPTSLFRRCRNPTIAHRHHHPDGGAALFRRSIEADALSSNHAESDGSDELLRIRGWIPRQPFEWRSKPGRWKRGRSTAQTGLWLPSRRRLR